MRDQSRTPLVPMYLKYPEQGIDHSTQRLKLPARGLQLPVRTLSNLPRQPMKNGGAIFALKGTCTIGSTQIIEYFPQFLEKSETRRVNLRKFHFLVF